MHKHVNRYAAFHESYYEHPCMVMTEKDVLETDIRGKGWYQAMKRYYHSWFLLSYNDERCRFFFTSSHALQLERARHFRQYRRRIHPLSKFINMWEVFILIVMLMNRIMIHHNTALFYGMQSAYTIHIGIIFEIFMQFDFIVNFKKGYLDEVARKVILDETMSYAHYASTKLFLHVASAVPLQLIMMLRYGVRECFLCRCNLFVCCLKLWSTFGLLRLYEVSWFLGRTRSSFRKMFILRILRVIILTVFTSMQFLDIIDTVNIIIMLNKQYIRKQSHLSIIMSTRLILNKMTDLFFICVELSLLCKSVLLFGYGMSKNAYYLDKIFNLICHIFSCLFFMWGLVECYVWLTRSKFMNDQVFIHQERMYNWLHSHQMSNSVYSKIKDFNDFNMTRSKQIELRNHLYKNLPGILIKEMKLNAYFPYLRRIPYFSEWPIELVEELCIVLKEEVFLEKDTVVLPFTQGEGLVIVFAGVLAVYTLGNKESGHLIDGDYMGELSLVTDREVRTSSLEAITISQVFIHQERMYNWLHSHQMSNSVYSKIKDFNDFNMTRSKQIELRNHLYKNLPGILIKEMKLNAYFPYLRRIPYFSEWPIELVEELCIVLKEEVFLEKDTVVLPFTQGEGLVIVFAGVLAVYTLGNKESGHLIDGDYMGELSLVTDREVRTSSLEAITISQVLILDKFAFRKKMRKYTQLFFELRMKLLKNYKRNSMDEARKEYISP